MGIAHFKTVMRFNTGVVLDVSKDTRLLMKDTALKLISIVKHTALMENAFNVDLDIFGIR